MIISSKNSLSRFFGREFGQAPSPPCLLFQGHGGNMSRRGGSERWSWYYWFRGWLTHPQTYDLWLMTYDLRLTTYDFRLPASWTLPYISHLFILDFLIYFIYFIRYPVIPYHMLHNVFDCSDFSFCYIPIDDISPHFLFKRCMRMFYNRRGWSIGICAT